MPTPLFSKTDGRAKYGLARMKEIGAEQQAKRQQLAAELLDGLGRQPRAVDRVLAHNLAGLTVRADYLEGLGRDATPIRREITALLKVNGLKANKVEPEPEPAS
jgi:hypothetical protein